MVSFRLLGVETPIVSETRDPVELGVELLAHLEHGELSVADALDRIETVTTNPQVQREILDTAVMRGLIERENGVVRPRDEVLVEHTDGRLLAVGRAELPGSGMCAFDTGMAVNVRESVD